LLTVVRHVLSRGADGTLARLGVQTLAIQYALSDGGRYRSGDLSCGPALTDKAFLRAILKVHSRNHV
jgi:hypothetical protein